MQEETEEEAEERAPVVRGGRDKVEKRDWREMFGTETEIGEAAEVAQEESETEEAEAEPATADEHDPEPLESVGHAETSEEELEEEAEQEVEPRGNAP